MGPKPRDPRRPRRLEPQWLLGVRGRGGAGGAHGTAVTPSALGPGEKAADRAAVRPSPPAPRLLRRCGAR